MSLPLPSLAELLVQTRNETAVPILELRVLLQSVTGLDKVAQITHDQAPMPIAHISAFKSLVARRQAGEPIAYLVGEQEFYSRPFYVDPRVLIPRPETEELVERALARLHPLASRQVLTRVLDVGTGSGAIAITLSLENPLLEVIGSDVSVDALAVARYNASRLKAPHVQWLHSDMLAQLPALHQFDLIVSNPPYIAAGDPHLSQGDLRHEPSLALTDQGDGLAFYRQLAEQTPHRLRPAGAVLMEHGHDQQAHVMAIFEQAGFEQVEGFADLAGTPRMVMASLKKPSSPR